MRWLIWGPMIVLLSAAALLGYRQGWLVANMTETAAIETYAARYLDEAGDGAKISDCWAQPGQAVWLVVRCGRDDAYYEYHVNRFGGLEQRFGPGEPLSPATSTQEPRT